MNSELNIFSQAFAAIVACWKYFFGMIAAIYVLEAASVVYDLGSGLTVARAFVESAIVFYICATLLGLDLKSKDTGKKYTGFMLRYILLLYLPVFIVAMVVVFGAMSAVPNSSQSQDIFLGVTLLSSGVVAFVAMFLFGTAFPAHLIGVSTGIGAAVSRSFRQAGYLLPRILLGAGSFAALAFVLLILFENTGIGSDPITPQGTPNIAGGIVLLIVKLVAGYSFAVFSVVVCRAYLKDLEERGELPVAEADVFA
ncbi:hypothetical protein [uncultured Roseibium sp.]|uniref:hypothetical protein n=1 Tax=uncultured Roseibium sp. TaxID=1936171 RepID=UPI002616E0D9|nr:hypothetical protein [uncultured Roseibium sp.]